MPRITPHLVEKPWAGSTLGPRFSSSHRNIGEAWLLSTLSEGQSKADGQPLATYLGRKLSFVVKIIDTSENLSIQVHPNDEWAKRLESSKGKSECWLVLNASAGAGVYLGLRKGVTLERFEQALHAGDEPELLMNFYSVSPGDFITVPAGTIHAIGGGVTLLEVQQASGITYRLWDWGRKDRELHLEKGLRVSNETSDYEIRRSVLDTAGPLMKHSDFECFINESHGEGWFIDLTTFDVTFASKPSSDQFVFVV